MFRFNKANLLHNLEILFVLSYMDLKVKYRGSFFGFFWSFLKPLLQFLVYYSIFGVILKIGNGHDYALQLFFGVLIWSWFAEATSLGLIAYISKKTIISKIKTNKTYPPLAAYLTPTMNYFLNFTIFLLAYLLFVSTIPHVLSLQNLLVFVLSIGAISVLIISVNLMLANLNVMYRDIQPIWELVLTYGVFLTPIIYHLPIPKKLEVLYYSLNLLALPLLSLKSIFFVNQDPIYQHLNLLVPYCISLSLLAMLSLYSYKKLSHKMVDFL
jgi:ABC-type polysaccharide/polyol phosphate export permease